MLLIFSKNLQLKFTPSSREMLITPCNVKRVEREQEKITAWEHLQKAKAEAAIQKLVVCVLFSLLLYF
jgi:hypothetical protein